MSDLYLFRSALRDLVRPKRVVMALALAALPAIIAAIWRYKLHGHAGSPAPSVLYNTLSAGLIFGFVLVLLSVVFGTGTVSQEMEQKTIIYLLTRPLPRWRILIARFVPVLMVVTVCVWLAATALALTTFGVHGLAHPLYRHDMALLPLGVVAYGALFLLVATFLPRPLLWGLLFTFGWEFWVPNLPGSFKKGSLMSYLRVLAPHPAPQNDAVDINELLNALNPTTISRHLAWEVLIACTIACTLLALIVFSRREYVPRDDAE